MFLRFAPKLVRISAWSCLNKILPCTEGSCLRVPCWVLHDRTKDFPLSRSWYLLGLFLEQNMKMPASLMSLLVLCRVRLKENEASSMCEGFFSVKRCAN